MGQDFDDDKKSPTHDGKKPNLHHIKLTAKKHFSWSKRAPYTTSDTVIVMGLELRTVRVCILQTAIKEK